MSILRFEIRTGAYHDSIVLMQLQSALTRQSDVLDAGVAMATEANLALLDTNGLLEGEVEAGANDLLVVVKAATEAAATAALGKIDELLVRRATSSDDYRPRGLEAACRMQPHGHWALISVPGRYAAEVSRDALALGRHVFLYSDNVSLADEVALKREAQEKGLLVLGPDCGTALVNGIGLGFANRVRRGPIGLIGASGTGLQAVTSSIHARGSGISHAIGTGGRDLKSEVGAITANQALSLLARDRRTEVIVLISKPPAPEVARQLLATARATGRPVVVDFIGYPPPARKLGNICFAASLGQTAELAVGLLGATGWEESGTVENFVARGRRFLRGLFAGGTLSYEVLLGLRASLFPLASNVALEGVEPLSDVTRSRGHTILDMGEDAFTVGRLHPMMDQDLRLRRLRQEAGDEEVAMIFFDVVLGDGAHSDPASELAPLIEELSQSGGPLFVAVVVGTDEDPQGLEAQCERLREAGVTVFLDVAEAVVHIDRMLASPTHSAAPRVDLQSLDDPMAAINVGVETFYESLLAQGAEAVQVDWKPPAGGNEKLQAILRKMRT
jgi:FdrA protein